MDLSALVEASKVNFDIEPWLVEKYLGQDKIENFKAADAEVQMNKNILVIGQFDPSSSDTQQYLRMMAILEKKRPGNQGRGSGQNYLSYCQKCQWEFEIATISCYRCSEYTISKQARHEELREIQEFEKNKKSDTQRKWEMMKTPQQLFKKTPNYGRWDYFGSSDDDMETVKVIQNDTECKMKKQRDQEKAEILKLQGNECMKNFDYEKAVIQYTLALELVKDIKALWLNRALAYIKLRKFRKAINDCSTVIDYAERNEKGYTVSREWCFKAFLRRGLAFKERKDYEQALSDAQQALLLCPKDKEALQLKKDSEFLRTNNQTFKEQEVNEFLPVELNYKKTIDLFVEKEISEIKFTDIMDLLKNMRFQPEQTKQYFYEKQGLKQLLQVILLNYICDVCEENETLCLRMVNLLLRVYLTDNPIYQEQFININGITIVNQRINSLLHLCQGQTKSYLYFLIEDYLELFMCIGNENRIRGLLNNNQTLINLIHYQLFSSIIQIHKSETQITYTFLTLCSNLCYGSSLFKQSFENNLINTIYIISPVLDITLESNKYVDLLIVLNNLLSNFLSETTFRQTLVQEEESQNLIFYKLVQQIKSMKMNEQIQFKWAESVLTVFINLLYQAKEDTQILVHKIGLGQQLIRKFLINDEIQPSSQVHRMVISRSIQVLSKLNYQLNKYLIYPSKKKFILYILEQFQIMDIQENTNDFTGNVLRMIMQVISTSDEEQKKLIKQAFQDSQKFYSLLDNLRTTLMSDHETIFCNCCNAIGQIIDLNPLSPEIIINQKIINPCTYFHQVIPRLITIVRDKQTNFRKNAGILLAKLAKDQSNLQTIRDLQGIEILKTITGLKIQK